MAFKDKLNDWKSQLAQKLTHEDDSWLTDGSTDEETIKKLKAEVAYLRSQHRGFYPILKTINYILISAILGVCLSIGVGIQILKAQPDNLKRALTASEKRALVMNELTSTKESSDLIRTPIKSNDKTLSNEVKEEAVKSAMEGGEAKDVSDSKKPTLPAKVDRIVELGMNNVRAVADSDGKVMFMGEGGRFVIADGKLFDIWARKELKTIDDMAYAASHLPVKDFGLTPEGKNVVTLGEGAEEVSIFVDPQCGWCHRLMQEIEADKTLLDRFTFNFYVVPALGDESNRLAKRLFCSDATNKAKYSALKSGREAIDALSMPNGKCKTDDYDQTLVMAQMLGVKGVPFLVSADGRFIAGKPKDIKAFLIPAKQNNKDGDKAKLKRSRM